MPTKLTRGAVMIAALAAGAFASLSGVAHADQVTDGSGGIGSGNQINVPIDVAVELCGNSVAAVVGVSEAECVQIAEELASDGSNQVSDGSGGIASGNQINIPVDIAVSLCGNSIAVAGVSQAECQQVAQELADGDDSTNQVSDGSGGIGSGNQVDVPIDADVEICGNAVAILGVATAECVTSEGETPEEHEPEDPGDNGCEGDNGGEGCTEDDNGCDGDGGHEEECEEGNGGDDNGGNGCDDGNGEDCPEGPGPEDQDGPEKDDETPDDANPPHAADSSSALPTTGSALYGILIAALALVTFGGGAIYLARRRRSRAGVES
ncbi:chaplin [Spiractinospora alimapuensis]|uniref:chaplin n=1 Tax=Spiractinospora alimapuensis TaxID=2820884 RepID=UPI001F341953|nr:chaplin [Spiractinospora alimapuensis]QVQ50347.1 chaplin [Spiractinospora alimapuensis]